MSDALQKLEHQKELKKAAKEAEADMVKDVKELKRDLKKRKWVDFRSRNDEDQTGSESKRIQNFDPADRIKRKKTAILLSYSGANYFGMQRNPGMQTIEEELFKAMLKHKWINEDGYDQAQNASFQRAARTDKGVSAARQICSMKLPETLDIPALNADLPPQIRLFGYLRVTKGFNAKDMCNARTYIYILPTAAFENFEQNLNDIESFRISPAQLQKVSEVLQLYEGTKNFHNFTSRKNFLDPSAKRFIMSFTASEPVVSAQGIEFITLRVKGQSFMLHQIRKMVGLAIAIVRGHTTTATLERAHSEERLDLPMAPGLGLVLDTVHYERYNERYGNDGIHAPLTWEQQETEIEEFVKKFILANIYETEHRERSMLGWLETLPLHSYDVRKEDEMKSTAEDVKDDNEE